MRNVPIVAGLSCSDRVFNVVSYCYRYSRSMAECSNTPPQKKLKGIPAKQKYKVEYSHKWPVLQKSKISGNHVYCQTCRADVSIGHSGLYDCRKQIESTWHVHAAGKACSKNKIDTFFSKDTEFATINVETLII